MTNSHSAGEINAACGQCEWCAKKMGRHIKTAVSSADVDTGADIVVDATGSGRAINEALLLCQPRGTIVLKSTVASQGELNLALIVINEVTLLGSRCGQFKDRLQMLESYPGHARRTIDYG